MQMQGRSSWRMVIDEPEDLHLVLFVRDCCRLPASAAGQPGALAPAVPDMSRLLDDSARRAAAEAWPAWWQAAVDAHRAVSGPPPHHESSSPHHRQAWKLHAAVDGLQFESLSRTPALREAARAAFGPFQQWWAPPILNYPPARPRPAGILGLPGVKGYLIDLHLGRSTDHDVVTGIERELGRRAKPFDLRIDILAVTQPPVIVQDTHYALISAELAGSEGGYRDWLYRAIRAIA